MLRPPSRRTSTRCAAVLALSTLAACGETFVDETAPTTLPPEVVVTTTTTEPIDPNRPLEATLADLGDEMRSLPDQIVENEGQQRTLARIEALWAVAEAEIRANDPDDLFNFSQAIDLARSGVDRRRPADASKGAEIFDDVTDAYLD